MCHVIYSLAGRKRKDWMAKDEHAQGRKKNVQVIVRFRTHIYRIITIVYLLTWSEDTWIKAYKRRNKICRNDRSQFNQKEVSSPVISTKLH